jgi:hypothetical protein
MECYRWATVDDIMAFLDVALPLGLDVTVQPTGFSSCLEPLLALHGKFSDDWRNWPHKLVTRLITAGIDTSAISLPWLDHTLSPLLITTPAAPILQPRDPSGRSSKKPAYMHKPGNQPSKSSQLEPTDVLPSEDYKAKINTLDYTNMGLSAKQRKKVEKEISRGRPVPQW